MPGRGSRGGGKSNMAAAVGGEHRQTRQSSCNFTILPVDEEDNDEGSTKCYKCYVCSKSLKSNDDCLQCERCLSWSCASCASVNDAEYEILSRPDFHWYCKSCQKPAQEAVRSDKIIEDRCKEYMKVFTARLDNMEKQLQEKANSDLVNKIDSDVKTLDKKISGIATDVSKVNEKCNLLCNEQAEKEKRKNNIVIRGLPEDLDNSNDADKVKTVFAAIGTEAIPKSILRLGKKPDAPAAADGTEKHRPLRVVLENVETKTDVIKKAPKIREAEDLPFPKETVFICPDQTKLEREQDVKL